MSGKLSYEWNDNDNDNSRHVMNKCVDLMYSIMTVINNIVLNTRNLPKLEKLVL